MEAIIVGLNKNKGKAIAQFSGEYILLELFDDDLDINDILIGNFDKYTLGSETIKNITQDKIMEVFIQDYCCKNLAIEYIKN